MGDRPHMALYALTSVACISWFAQTLRESYAAHTLTHGSTIIFLLCIAVGALYCGANALILAKRQYKEWKAGRMQHTQNTADDRLFPPAK